MKIFVLFFIIAAFNFFSCLTVNTGNSGTGDVSVANSTINIRGRVQVYGNEPRTYVGIVALNGTEYSVYPPSYEDELRKLQGRLIDFTAVLLNEPQGYGSLFLKGGTVTPVSWNIID